VNPLITFKAFNPTDYPSVSSQSCDLTVESNLVQVVSALNGTVTVAAIACSALPPIASNVCDAAVAVVGVAGAVSQGLLADCSEQDGNVNAAQIDAAFHNTVTIFNSLNGINDQITSEFNAASTQLTNVNSQITGEFGIVNANLSTDFVALTTQLANVDTHLTNVDTHIAAEFTTLTTVVNQATAQLNAELKQIMKLELTPDGLKVIDPPILTCRHQLPERPGTLPRCWLLLEQRRASSLEERHELIENGTGHPQACCSLQQARETRFSLTANL
jgi:hypothetical protein